MRLLRLKGTSFRNIQSLDVTFNPHCNVIYGDNGSGKSTFLEMIYCLGRGRSFRTHLASPIIQYHKDQCTVFGELASDSFATSIGFQKASRGKTQLRIGYDKHTPSLKELAQLLPLQLFHPESHDLLNNGPKQRRQFIDWALFYTEPRFISLWSRYQHALRQRNAAIVQKQAYSQIQLWDAEIVEIGEMLSQIRAHYIQALIPVITSFNGELLEGYSIAFEYFPGWDTHYSLFQALKNTFEQDMRYGYTRAGPHRFDFYMRINGFSVEEVLSRGEQKRLICALYLARGALLKQLTGQRCIYLLDDILSELDGYYQTKVIQALLQLDAQIFVTTLQKEIFSPLLHMAECKLFHVTHGSAIEE
jgi:DNA replication and repair protein RecF